MVEPLPAEESVSSKTALQVGVQLLKRHHQLHSEVEEWRTPSIVLTTIAGNEAPGNELVGDCMNEIVAGAEAYARTPQHVYHPTAQDELLSEKWNDANVYAQFQQTTARMLTQWAEVVSAQGKGLPTIADLLNTMFGEEPVTRAIKAIGTEAGSMKKQGRLSTGVGGAVSIVGKGRGNKKGTFYGDA